MSNPATPGARHALYAVLEEVLGDANAETLMTYLPEHRGDEVATKNDMGRLETELGAFRAEMNDRFSHLETRIDASQRLTVTAMVGLTAIFSTLLVVTQILAG